MNSTATRLVGSAPLKAERSTNVSAGIVVEPIPRLDVALDVYQIKIRDRIVNGGGYSGIPAVNALATGGFSVRSSIDPPGASDQYFSNGASTHGLDTTADNRTRFGRYGNIDWTFGLDLNRTRQTDLGNDAIRDALLTVQVIASLTTSSPRRKTILRGHWNLGAFDATLLARRRGSVTDILQYQTWPDANSITVCQPFEAEPRYLTDLELGYRITPAWHVAVGANDLFDSHPTLVPVDTRLLGVTVYDYFVSQFGYNGGFYSAHLNYTF